jgi:hypothetical protein
MDVGAPKVDFQLLSTRTSRALIFTNPHNTTQPIIAASNPDARKGPRSASMVFMSAVVTNSPNREIVLFRPDATPALRPSTIHMARYYRWWSAESAWAAESSSIIPASMRSQIRDLSPVVSISPF